MDIERIVDFFKKEFFPDTFDAIHQGQWEGYEVYTPRYPLGLHLGDYNFGLVKGESIRMASLEEAVQLNDELDL